jgi:hypothetical protein
LLEGCPIVRRATVEQRTIPRAPLLACAAMPSLPAAAVSRALAAGLRRGGLPQPDEYLLRQEPPQAGLQEALSQDGIDARLQRARALIIAAGALGRENLLGSAPFELATRARQGGVPAYAVIATPGFDPFIARMLDLQVVLLARSARSLAAAGRRLAALV